MLSCPSHCSRARARTHTHTHTHTHTRYSCENGQRCKHSPSNDHPQPPPSLGALVEVLPDRHRPRARDGALQKVSQYDQQPDHRPYQQSNGRLVSDLVVHAVGEVGQVAEKQHQQNHFLDVSRIAAEETTDEPVEAIQAAGRGRRMRFHVSSVAFFIVCVPRSVHVLNVNLCVSVFGTNLRTETYRHFVYYMHAYGQYSFFPVCSAVL